MTDRVNSFIVVLEDDIRSDDAETIANAIRCLRHVLTVSPVVTDSTDYVARARIRDELGRKLIGVVYPERNQK